MLLVIEGSVVVRPPFREDAQDSGHPVCFPPDRPEHTR
jgi:hypothetical protein